jgi:hypothetical protein
VTDRGVSHINTGIIGFLLGSMVTTSLLCGVLMLAPPEVPVDRYQFVVALAIASITAGIGYYWRLEIQLRTAAMHAIDRLLHAADERAQTRAR